MGLEALSRGAAQAVEVDASADAVRTIRANLKNTGLDRCPCEVLREDVFNAVARFGRTGRTFDLVYADPPFTQPEMLLPLMDALGDGALLAPGASLVVRTEQRLELPEEAGSLARVRQKRYGISTVHFYEARV
jgi:16S rRNA (guanine(966)-N(2))-methyltransferase RsmD